MRLSFSSDPGEARTLDPLIKSPFLAFSQHFTTVNYYTLFQYNKIHFGKIFSLFLTLFFLFFIPLWCKFWCKFSNDSQSMEGFRYDTKATVNIRLDKRRPLKSGKFPVKVEVYFMGQKKRYEAKISLSETEWEKMSAPKLKDEELKEKRIYIKNIEKKALDIVKDMGDQFTMDSFDVLFLGSESKLIRNKQDVYAAFEIYIGKLREEGRIGTEKSYEAALKSLRQFMPKLNFADITVPFLESYERYMLKEDKSVTTVGIYLRSLRTIVNIARSDKVVSEEQYPFGLKSRKKYEIPRANNIKKALDEGALTKVLTCECQNDEEAWARDMWLFREPQNSLFFSQ